MPKTTLLFITLTCLINIFANGTSLHENINVEKDLTFAEGNIQTLLLSNDIKSSSIHTEGLSSTRLHVGSLYVEKMSNPTGDNIKVSKIG